MFSEDDILHAMRFLGTEDRQAAIAWLEAEDKKWRQQ